MPRPLNQQIVVVTGASSGIGREAALAFASRGATVVVAARNELGLNTLVEEISRFGGAAVPVVCDVTNWDDVKRLADTVVDRFGRIDTWVNNAGVSMFATVEDSTLDEIERIFRVDVFGMIYGVKAVLPYMRQQGGGTIINVGSALSNRAVPLQTTYSAAKHAVKGFTEGLRMELEHENSGINVTLVMPASINTPFFEHARSKMRVMGKPMPPVYEPGAVADAIVSAAESPKRDIFVGSPGKVFLVGEALAPGLLDRGMMAGGMAFRQQQSDQPPPPEDNLFTPIREPGRAAAEWHTVPQNTSLYMKLIDLQPAERRLLAGAAIIAGLLWLRSRSSNGRHDRSERFDYHDGVFAGPPEAPMYRQQYPVADIDGGYLSGEYIPAT